MWQCDMCDRPDIALKGPPSITIELISKTSHIHFSCFQKNANDSGSTWPIDMKFGLI
jgi:hypothetical protein